MEKFVTCILSLLTFAPFTGKVDLPTAYIHSHFDQLTEEQVFALSIGAPEISRYQEVQNLLETEVLELTYVTHGSGLVDFSIGPFQMKPSFIERLEYEVETRCELSNYLWITEYPDCDSQAMRKQRIQHISDPKYILTYLEAFQNYCQLAYELDKMTLAEQLKFIATAYNLGFDRSNEEILAYQGKAYFPYGPNFQGKQSPFADLSLAIYNQLINTK